MHDQLRSAQLYIAQQRSATPCGAVPCPALRCCGVLLHAFFRTYSSTRYETKYQASGTGMYVLCTRLFAFSSFISLGPHVFSPTQITSGCCRSERDTANKHTVQHRALSSAQAARDTINSLFAPNHGPLISSPFTCVSCILPCASVAGGVSRPRSGALVLSTTCHAS